MGPEIPIRLRQSGSGGTAGGGIDLKSLLGGGALGLLIGS